MTFISEPSTDRFYHFGQGNRVMEHGDFTYPEEVSIGDNVFIRDGYWFNIITPGLGSYPKIIIGNGSQCNRNFTVSAVNQVVLEDEVLVGPNVYISDTDHQYREIGISILSQWITSTTNTVTIGQGSWIGANSVIVGNVRVGKGCVIGANSVVVRDIPDYCVVTGSPATIMRIYDPSKGSWVRVNSPEEAQHILDQRRAEPLLSICIPTYNRAQDLERCLESIYSQIGNTDLIEVRISDNASDDETPEVINKYKQQYTNLYSSRNAENIGADRNILAVLEQGRGKFIKMHGDDDFFKAKTLIPFLHILHKYKDCAVFHINVFHQDEKVLVEHKEGLSAFLASTSIYSSFITSTILRRADWEQLQDHDRYMDSSFNQIYVQYALLANNPNFCVVHSNMFSYAGNPSTGYNFGRVFIDSYQRILADFVDLGLTAEDIRVDKQRVFYNFILPYYSKFATEGATKIIEGFEDYFTAHYKDEVYYEEALKVIQAIHTA